MSLHAFHVALALRDRDVPFAALIFAAMLRADTDNAVALAAAFPGLQAECAARYDAPGGALGEERVPTNAERQRLRKQWGAP